MVFMIIAAILAVLRWTLVMSQPDEWLLCIRNGQLVKAGVGIYLWRKPGDVVAADQTLAILESMKMEISITAPHDGVVYAISRNEGNQVNTGQPLLILQES